MEFRHTPIMLNEVIDGLNIKPNGVYFDGTLGGAGHSSEILKRLTTGLLIGCDKDSEALAVSDKRLNEISSHYKLVHNDYKNYAQIIKDLGLQAVDGILLDLGVSSYQLDNSERGFSYRYNAPLDMRMDRESFLTAKQVVNTYSQKELEHILFAYGEEPFSKQIAKNIVLKRQEKPIETTFDLVDIIKQSLPEKVLRSKGHPAKRTFQAIRIEVNNEIEPLYNTVINAIDSLKPGGRLCIITFHSLEDRAVKDAYKDSVGKCTCPPDLPYCVCGNKSKGKIITKKPILPTEEEMKINSRSKSAKLRIFEKN